MRSRLDPVRWFEQGDEDASLARAILENLVGAWLTLLWLVFLTVVCIGPFILVVLAVHWIVG